MRETKDNLWDYPADVRVITTNGSVKLNGAAVMGRGVALQAKQRYPGIEYDLGRALTISGNVVHWLSNDLVSFPVKHEWMQKADIDLIKHSAKQIVDLANAHKYWNTIAMPRPGCGNGGLDWSEVRGVIKSILDDRFVVVQK